MANAREIRFANHPTIDIRHPVGGKAIPIDRAIAPLISAIWALGWNTFDCCQNWNGRVFLTMPCQDAQKLIALIASKARSPVARGAVKGPSWDIWATPLVYLSREPDALTVDFDEAKRLDDVRLAISFLFPARHLAEVTRVIKERLTGCKATQTARRRSTVRRAETKR